ncbi:MAG: phosphoglycerate mutase family protein [Bacteroidota bacterium]
MKKNLCLLFLFIFAFSYAHAQREKAVTTFILLRHSEKVNDGTSDPDLKPEGVERSNRIANMLGDVAIDAVYSTNYKRTRNTITPLAQRKNLEVQQYEAFKPEVIEEMIKKHNGGTIVVSGHSNNIPWIANLLMGKEEYKTYDDADYGIMLIVSVVEKGKVAKVTRINY